MDGLGQREAIIRIYCCWRIARAPLRPPLSPPRQPSEPGTAQPTPFYTFSLLYVLRKYTQQPYGRWFVEGMSG